MPSRDQSSVSPSVCSASQTCLLRTYDGGEFAHLLDLETVVEIRKAVGECGDTLLTFLFVELGGAEDCSDTETAVGRVELAMRQLTVLRDALLVEANWN